MSLLNTAEEEEENVEAEEDGDMDVDEHNDEAMNMNMGGDRDVELEDSDDETYHNEASLLKPHHFHEDSVISVFDQDAVVDSSAQIAIYAAEDIDNIGDAEHDVDEVKVSSEGKEPELEDAVSQRDVRR